MAKSASGTGSWRYVKVHLEQFDRAGVIELIPLHDRKEEQLAWMPSVIS